jgi:methyl coenzyme M reductase subunit C-like uncharacterized protein (methanogenesis marker protein 7)
MPSGKREDRYPLAAGLGYPLHLTQRHVDHGAAFSPENVRILRNLTGIAGLGRGTGRDIALQSNTMRGLLEA